MTQTATVPGRAFGEGRNEEIEGYQAAFLDWVIETGGRVVGPLLDCGTNNGFMLWHAYTRHGLHSLGVDVNPQRQGFETPVARQAGGGVFFADTVTQYPVVLKYPIEGLRSFPNQSFGLVTWCHVLEHVENPTEALRQSWRLLKPGGHLAIAVPHQHSADWIHDDGSHLSIYTEPFLRRRVTDVCHPDRIETEVAELRGGHPEIWLVGRKP